MEGSFHSVSFSYGYLESLLSNKYSKAPSSAGEKEEKTKIQACQDCKVCAERNSQLRGKEASDCNHFPTSLLSLNPVSVHSPGLEFCYRSNSQAEEHEKWEKLFISLQRRRVGWREEDNSRHHCTRLQHPSPAPPTPGKCELPP